MDSYGVYALCLWFVVVLGCLCSVLYDLLKANEEIRRKQ